MELNDAASIKAWRAAVAASGACVAAKS